jgi:dihydroorotate dehydrogenase electron transfer subunit
MKQTVYGVIDSARLWSNTQWLTIDAPELARSMQAGQFALVSNPSSFDPYLRRTAWVYRIENERVTFVLRAEDVLTRQLRPGDFIDVLAPLGNSIQFDANVKRVLIIGEQERIAQLIPIAEMAIRQQREVVLVHHAVSSEKIFPAYLLAPEIEYRTDPAQSELLTWADALVLSGSEEFYRTMADATRDARYRLENGFARALIDIPMPCGTGECFACAIDTRHGVERACVDGPWFDLSDWELRRAR